MSSMFALAATPTVPGRGGTDARLLLELLYRQATGRSMPPLRRHKRGKPYFTQGGLHCSISHTRTMAFCVLSQVAVGLDAEQLGRAVRPGLAEKVLSPREYALWRQAPDPNALFLTLWTLKESTVKYTGDGLRGYPNHLSFDPSGPTLDGSSLHFRLWTWENHVVALCAPEPPPADLEIRRFF